MNYDILLTNKERENLQRRRFNEQVRPCAFFFSSSFFFSYGVENTPIIWESVES